MSADQVNCFNCGNPNPAWAQVCRTCGVLLSKAPPPRRSVMRGTFPSDQASLLAMGASLGTIVLAIFVGVILSGVIPSAPNVAETTPTPEPTISASPAPTREPTLEPTVAPSVEPSVTLPGRLAFGTALNLSTREAINLTNTFGPGVTFAHSISMPAPFGVRTIFEEVSRVNGDGSETVVQARADGDLTVASTAQIAGFSVPSDNLIRGWGAGTYVFRDYINGALVAEGTITLTS
ncbi:MAG TPA: zinc ribbon domain-containing protein [Candidatus Limnocylindria bacterium]|nr:zinc ribbon domain-containing protein [Candidatus Limnocylindria bacterium]